MPSMFLMTFWKRIFINCIRDDFMLYIGIDLGTSACKPLLVDESGAIVNAVTKEYPHLFPHPG